MYFLRIVAKHQILAFYILELVAHRGMNISRILSQVYLSPMHYDEIRARITSTIYAY